VTLCRQSGIYFPFIFPKLKSNRLWSHGLIRFGKFRTLTVHFSIIPILLFMDGQPVYKVEWCFPSLRFALKSFSGPLMLNRHPEQFVSNAVSMASVALDLLDIELLFIAFQTGHIQIALQSQRVSPSWLEVRLSDACRKHWWTVLQTRSTSDLSVLIFITQVHAGSTDLKMVGKTHSSLYIDSADTVLSLNYSLLLQYFTNRAKGVKLRW